MPSRYIIYALQDPLSWELRYVGRSSSGLHRPRSKHDARCENWRKWLARRGKLPVVVVLQEFPGTTPNVNDVLNAAEIYWIAELRRRGCPLTNCTDGGDGQCGVKMPWLAERNQSRVWTAEQREKMAALYRGSKSPRFGKKESPEAKAKNRAAHLGLRRSPETRARISAARKLVSQDPVVRARMSEAQRGRRASPEARAKMSAARRGKPSGTRGMHFVRSEAYREKQREAWRRRRRQQAESNNTEGESS